MAESSVPYSHSQQLIILWWCLGAGGFLSVIIFCWCRVLNKQPKIMRVWRPTPAAAASRPRGSKPLHSVIAATAPQAAAGKVFEINHEGQRPIDSAEFHGQISSTTLNHSQPIVALPSVGAFGQSRQFNQVPIGESSGSAVEEMQKFVQAQLARSVLRPVSVIAAERPSSFHATELNTRPPADAASAAQEMMQYTHDMLESMTMRRSQPNASVVKFPEHVSDHANL
jgi:hypothetical protein